MKERKTVRAKVGSAAVVVLIAGISLVLVVASLLIFRRQTQASEKVQQELVALNNQDLAAGKPYDPANLPQLRPAAITSQTTEYSGVVRFSYPKGWVVDDTTVPGTITLASHKALLETVVGAVPEGHALAQIRTNVKMSYLNDPVTELKKIMPYSVKHRSLTLKNGAKAIEFQNESNGLVWITAFILPENNQQYLQVVTLAPPALVSPAARQAYQLILDTFEVKE